MHAIGGAEAKVGGGTAINKDVETAAAHDRDLLIPLILGVVLLILGLLLRAIVAPLVLIATVVLSFASASASPRCSSSTCSASRARIPGCRCSSSCSWWRSASTTTSS